MKHNIIIEKMFSSPYLFSFVLLLFSISCNTQTSNKQTSQSPLFIPAPNSPITMNCAPGNILAGDFNNDKIPDLAVACGENRSIHIFTGSGNGEFKAISGSPVLLKDPPHELAAADMNRDGYIDLVIASHDSYGVTILSGDGKGIFKVSANSPVIMKNGDHPHTHGLGIGDMNEDGNPDIVTANNADYDISVVLSDGRGGFTPSPGSPFAVSYGPYPLTIGDVNGDGHLDIVSTSTMFGNKHDPHVLSLLSGNGKGDFKRNDLPVRTSSPWFVAIGDINKDNKPDLITTHGERPELTVLVNDNNTRFTELAASPFDLGSNASHIALADVNDDGYTDVLAAAGNGIRIMSGDGTGKFKPIPGSPFPTGKGTWRLVVSDINGDSKPDIVATNLESNSLSVLLRN